MVVVGQGLWAEGRQVEFLFENQGPFLERKMALRFQNLFVDDVKLLLRREEEPAAAVNVVRLDLEAAVTPSLKYIAD